MARTETYGNDDSKGFLAIEGELQKRRDQAESVKGKETPYRVEFRYKGGTAHWQYFESYEDACKAEDSGKCRYSPWGNAIIEYSSSRQIQVKGVRGGWKKATPASGVEG